MLIEVNKISNESTIDLFAKEILELNPHLKQKIDGIEPFDYARYRANQILGNIIESGLPTRTISSSFPYTKDDTYKLDKCPFRMINLTYEGGWLYLEAFD